jgi:hypothetical protein
MLFIDHKYISQVGPQLDKFKRKNTKTYNLRCPFCLDSAKSKIKARGYFITKGDNLHYYCHNCGRSCSLGDFLKEINFDLYEQYIFERYKEKTPDKKDEYGKFNFKPNFQDHISTGSNNYILDTCVSIADLSDLHYARTYIAQRQIPVEYWNDIYFINDFKSLVDKIEPDNEYGITIKEPRIIIPFRNKEKRITAIQGRSFSNKGLRYITIKVDKESPKIYGLDRVVPTNKVYVVEGPFDSLCISNSIAAAGSNLGSSDLSLFDNLVFLYDNEPRNKTLIENMKRIADSGKKLCVWPDNIYEKDLNDMILSGKTSKEIMNIIDNNTFTGLQARIAINEWRRN